MISIHSILQKIQARKNLCLQLLFVVLAFILMIVSSALYVNNMLRSHLHRDATDMLTQTKLKIEAEFIEPQTAMIAISEIIRNAIIRGDSADKVLATMKHLSRELQRKPGGFTFDDIYGYFEVFGGVYLTATEWDMPEDFNSLERPWYKTAVEAGDKIAITPIYTNLRINDYIVTYVRRIFDNSGRPLGVVCLNVPIDRIRALVTGMNLTKGSYGALLNEKLDIIVHPNRSFVGINLLDAQADKIEHAEAAKANSGIIQREMLNYEGVYVIMCVVALENGWILSIQTPKAEYYRELNEMLLILSILGTILAATLCFVLINVDKAKNRADEESRRKSMQLALVESTREADERTQLMLDATPLCVNFLDKDYNNIACNEEAVRLFGLNNKQEYLDKFYELSPERQPCGRPSKEMAVEFIKKAFEEGYCRVEWMHQKLNGEQIPCEVTLVRIKYKDEDIVLGYTRDLRELKQMIEKIERRDDLLNMINHVAVVLLATENDENMLAPILKGMDLLGRSMEVDRIQIWQNEMIDGSLHFVHKYEWLSEFGRQKAPVPIGLSFPYGVMPEWEGKFLRDEYINGPFRELPQRDQDFLRPYDIQTIVIIPLFLQDRLWGFFSLDDCQKEQTFSEEVINILRSGGLLIANAFLRNEMTQNIRSAAVQLEAALNEAQEANKTKSKFLATISHEIRTPMNVILGVTESQLSDESHSVEIKEAFEKIYNSGDLLLHIINDILDLSKIEAGKLELLPEKYEVLSLINDVANINIIQFGHKRLQFKLQVDENIPLYLYGDELRIKQILNNILSNAFKYTRVGEVALSFAAEKIEENKIILVITIRDTGQGMTPEQINRMFDEYIRFNLETNRTTAGVGLGMAITRNLVKMMGGQSQVNSTPGEGTMFTVRIPQEVISSDVLGKEIAEKLQSFHFTNQMRERYSKIVHEPMPYGKVLVVDDMPSNIDVAKLLLSQYELQIDTAESGFEAIDIIKNGKEYDIVFIDHMMPVMDGIETTKKLRELGYKHPIFALTANAVAGQRDIFLASGFDGYISKPIDIRRLNDSLNRFIRNKERSRQQTEESVTPVKSVSHPPADEETQASQAINIPGVDTERGLALYGEDMDIYLSVLRSFVSNALSNIDKLRNVSEESLPEYAINVHGMKSISANIGAENLREAAFNLEMLAKSGDLTRVLAGNGAFLEIAENVVSAVQVWLKEYNISRPKPQFARPDRTLLYLLHKYCATYDMKNIDEVMDQLESADYDTDASLVIWLRERINESDFSSVVERLSTYVGESK